MESVFDVGGRGVPLRDHAAEDAGGEIPRRTRMQHAARRPMLRVTSLPRARGPFA